MTTLKLTNDKSMVTTKVLDNQNLNGSINYKKNNRVWHVSEKFADSERQQKDVCRKSSKIETTIDSSLIKDKASMAKAYFNQASVRYGAYC